MTRVVCGLGLAAVFVLCAIAWAQGEAKLSEAKMSEPEQIGAPIQNANLISYRLCLGYGVEGHDLLCWTTTAESGAHFCALDLETERLEIKPLGHLEGYPITPASDGAIYIGSSSGEIWRYRAAGSVWEVVARPWDLSGGRGVHHVRALAEGRDGWLYCGSCEGERARVHKETGAVEKLPSLPEAGHWYVSAIVPLLDGRVAFGCGHKARIFVYDPAEGRDVAQWAPASWQADGFIISATAGRSVLFAKHFPSGRRGAFDMTTGEFLGEAPWPPDVLWPRWSRWVHNSGYGSGIDFYVLPGTDTIATCDGKYVYLWDPRQGAKKIPARDFKPPATLAKELKYGVTTDLRVLEYDRVRLKVRRQRLYEQPRVLRGLFGLGVGPDGCIYGGAYQSTHLFRYDPRTKELWDLGDHNPGWSGEIYSFCLRGQDLVCASYINGAIVLYNPFRKWRCDNKEQHNPRFVGCLGQYTYRPYACTATRDGRIFGVGAAGWGSTGGGVSWIDPQTGKTGSTRLPTAPFAVAEISLGELVVCDDSYLRWWDAHRNEEHARWAWPHSPATSAVLMTGRSPLRLAYLAREQLHIVRLVAPGEAILERSTPLPVSGLRVLWEGEKIIVGGATGVAEYDPETGEWAKLSALGPTSQFAFVVTKEGIYFTRGPYLYRLPRAKEERR